MEGYISIEEASKLLNRTARMILLYAKQGKINKYKILGRVFFEKEEVLSLLKPKRC